MSNERKVRKLHYAVLTHNTVSAVGADKGAPMRDLVRMATGVGVQSGHGPDCLGRWTLCTGTFPDSATECRKVADALDNTDPYADHSTLTARAAAHYGVPTADILVSRCDREAMAHLLSALGAADTSTAELARAATAWRAAVKGDGKTSTGDTSNDGPKVSSKRASATTTAPRSNAATLDIGAALAGVQTMLRAVARQCATAFVVSSDNATRGALGIIGRDLAAMFDAASLPNIGSDAIAATYSLRADITVGASVTGKRVDNGETVSGVVAKVSPNAVALTDRDDDGDRIMIARDTAVATIDGTAVNDALSIWGFAPEAPAMPDTTTATESSGSIDPTNIGAAPTVEDLAAMEARAEADAAELAALDTTAPVEAPVTPESTTAPNVETAAPAAPLDTSKRKGRKGA